MSKKERLFELLFTEQPSLLIYACIYSNSYNSEGTFLFKATTYKSLPTIMPLLRNSHSIVL